MKDPVILVSLDGMPEKVFENAWKYHGSDLRVQELETVYPSVTVPAHVSILTGKTPQEHGIMENLVIKGPGFQKVSLYHPTKEEARQVMPGDTIVHEFTENGLSCGSINWPLGGGLPGENHSEDLTTHEGEEGVEAAYEKDLRALRLLKEEMRRKEKDFIAAHFEEYDGAAHIYGLESERTNLACDHMIEYVRELIHTARECGVGAMLFFSDHGMLDKEENFFPNIYAAEHGFAEEIAGGELQFLSDGSGCMQMYSGMDRKKNEAAADCLIESGKIRGIRWLSGSGRKELKRPCAILEMRPGICSEDVMERTQEKYRLMKGLHGYDPRNVRQMNGFVMAYDPQGRLELSGGELKITDIPHLIRKLVTEGRKDR